MENSEYQCRICNKLAARPVITLCGHMFCWDCIDRVLTQDNSSSCPVCRSGVSKETLTPIYITEEAKSEANSNPRPQATREPARSNPNYSRFTGIFDSSTNSRPAGISLNMFNTMNHEDQRADILSKLMLIIGLIILISVLF